MTMSRPSHSALTFADAIELAAALMRGEARQRAVDALVSAGGLAALRRAMQTHSFPGAGGPVSLRRLVDSLDARTRREGLHVLHGWDFTRQRRPDDIAPVLLLDYCDRVGVPADRQRAAVAALLDEYCAAILALLTVRAWDEGDANANLDAIDALIRDVNGPDGSGHSVVDDAGTLLILAVAYYHPEEAAYDALVAKVWTLQPTQALRVALPGASVLASHLRWGLRFMYRNDVGRMREDNVVDYPWVLFSLLTIAAAVERSVLAGESPIRRAPLVAGLLDGLTADSRAFLGSAPAFLAHLAPQHAELRAILLRQRGLLLTEWAAFAPVRGSFSPLSVGCNFLSNAAVAAAVGAATVGTEHPTLNALMRDPRSGTAGESMDGELFARQLMEFSTADQGRLGAGGAPLIVYDPLDGMHHYNDVVRVLREASGA
ncbi:MAG: hypothetical protein P3A28_04680 [Gemmatimonadota bacterium]|nr:hypothetical protein [Gemmatimonadota bacterium]